MQLGDKNCEVLGARKLTAAWRAIDVWKIERVEPEFSSFRGFMGHHSLCHELHLTDDQQLKRGRHGGTLGPQFARLCERGGLGLAELSLIETVRAPFHDCFGWSS